MDNRLSFKKKLALFPLKFLAFIATVIGPFLGIFIIGCNVEKDDGDGVKTIIQKMWKELFDKKITDKGESLLILIAFAAVLIFFAIIYVKVIKKRINRRLQSEDTVEALGAVPARSIIWKNIFKSLELLFPILMVTLILVAVNILFIDDYNFVYDDYKNLSEGFTILYWLVISAASGIVLGMIFNIINDSIKIKLIRRQIVDNEIKRRREVEKKEIIEAIKDDNKHSRRRR